jgi:hypothetical protein
MVGWVACLAGGLLFLLIDDERLPEPFRRIARWFGRRRAGVLFIVLGLAGPTLVLAQSFGWF